MLNKTLSFLGNIAFLLWSIACLLIFMYYPGAISHMHGVTLYDFSRLSEKLPDILTAAYLLDTLWSFLGMVFFGISCVSLGMKLASISPLDHIIDTDLRIQKEMLLPTYFLIGNAVFSLVFLTMASLSSFSPIHSLVILSFGVLSGLKHIKLFSLNIPPSNSRYGKAASIACLIILIASIFQSSSHLSYDASATYFSMAKLTALKHHIGFYLDNVFPISAFHSVIQYTAIIQVFGDQSARMISWLFGVMNLAIAVAIAKLVGASALTRQILPALVLTSTAFLDHLGDGKVELFSSAYAMIAIFWMVVQTQKIQRNWFLYFFTGCFVGFSCILRPYNVFLLGLFILIHLSQQMKSGKISFSQAARSVAWLALGASGFAVYHLIINKIILDSPFAFWSSVTSIKPEGPWDFRPEVIWTYRILYPFVVTFKNTGASLGNITPLVLIFLPLFLISNNRNDFKGQREASQLVISSIATLVLWVGFIFAVVEIRYVIFLWIILFIPVAEVAVRAIESGNILIKSAVMGSIILLMGYILVRSIFISIYAYSPVDKQGNPQCFDNSICGHLVSINQLAVAGERVLTLSGYRYYLRTDLFVCSTNHTEYTLLKASTSQGPDAFWREVYRQGYRYIAYEKGYTTDHVLFEIIPSPINTPSWVNLVPIFGKPGDLQVAYRIDITSPPLQIKMMCKKNSVSGLWEVQPVSP